MSDIIYPMSDIARPMSDVVYFMSDIVEGESFLGEEILLMLSTEKMECGLRDKKERCAWANKHTFVRVMSIVPPITNRGYWGEDWDFCQFQIPG